MTSNEPNGNAVMINENSNAERPRRKSSAARVRALRERRLAAGKRLISVYLSQEECDKLQDLAASRGWSQSIAIGACVRHAWDTVIGAKKAASS